MKKKVKFKINRKMMKMIIFMRILNYSNRYRKKLKKFMKTSNRKIEIGSKIS